MARKKQQYGLGSIFRKKTKDPVTGITREIPTWQLQFYVNGRVHRESARTTIYNEAQKKLKRRFGETINGTLPDRDMRNTLVSELLEDLLADYKRHNPKSLKCFAGGVVKRLQDHFGARRAAKVQTRELAAFVEACESEDLAPATINRHLALLRRAYKLGTLHTPRKVELAAVPNIAMHFATEDNVRRGFFEHADYLKMRDALQGSGREAMVFAYYTGCRMSEVLNLRWDQVDWQGRIVRLQAGETKSNEGRCLPMGEELHTMMLNQFAHRPEGCPWVFYLATGERMATVRRAWAAACKATGIDRLFHDLRRTAVRNMIRAGVPENVAMAISGHKTRAIFSRYSIVDEADLHKAAKAYSTYVGTSFPTA